MGDVEKLALAFKDVFMLLNVRRSLNTACTARTQHACLCTAAMAMKRLAVPYAVKTYLYRPKTLATLAQIPMFRTL